MAILKQPLDEFGPIAALEAGAQRPGTVESLEEEFEGLRGRHVLTQAVTLVVPSFKEKQHAASLVPRRRGRFGHKHAHVPDKSLDQHQHVGVAPMHILKMDDQWGSPDPGHDKQQQGRTRTSWSATTIAPRSIVPNTARMAGRLALAERFVIPRHRLDHTLGWVSMIKVVGDQAHEEGGENPIRVVKGLDLSNREHFGTASTLVQRKLLTKAALPAPARTHDPDRGDPRRQRALVLSG